MGGGPDGAVLGSPQEGVSDEKLGEPDLDADGDGRIGDVSLSRVDEVGSGSVTQVQALTDSGRWTVLTYQSDDQLHAGLATRWAILGVASVGLLVASVVTGGCSLGG